MAETAARTALAKLVALLPPPRPPGPAPAPRGRARTTGPEPAASHPATIRQAIAAEQRLHLRYADRQGAGSDRIIWPIALDDSGRPGMLAAWCELRRDFRHFRLDRILGVRPAGGPMPKRRRLLLAEWRLRQDEAGY
ncbi:helix-turn-helix transcriptional regulator [Roseicella frigidaeris]|uniref:WYL domain-containing protein n=1 Tax=Roseicella frigidaeris TaxID=2230885 RepID=A0A327MA34_9PROT|nr:WYL domain-containing protein [Roseicella frigidaeris]RAI59295.1 hypothetical protein DOO78_09715 [Roseicella frigidaeris]